MDEQKDWHRLFGLILADFFAGTRHAVEVEKDLPRKPRASLRATLVARRQS